MKFYITENRFDIKNNRHYEGLLCLGNGYIHTRASVEEGFEEDDQSYEYMRLPTNTTLEKFRESKSKWGTYMPGFMAMHPLLKEEIVNLPYFLDLKVYIDGQRFTLEKAEIISYERTLDMKNALLTRKFHVKFNGNELNFCFERFLSASVKNLSAQKLCIASDKFCKIDIVGGIDAGVRTNGFNHFKKVEIISKEFPCLEIKSDKGETCRICSKLEGKESCCSLLKETVYTGEKLHFENTKEVRESGCPPQVQRRRTSILENSLFPKARHDFISARIEPISLAALVLLSSAQTKPFASIKDLTVRISASVPDSASALVAWASVRRFFALSSL